MKTKADKIADDLLDWADEIEALDVSLSRLENKLFTKKFGLAKGEKSLQQLVKTLHIAAGMLTKND